MEDDLERKQDDDAALLVPCGQQREHNCRKDCVICCPVRSSGEDRRFFLRRVSKFFLQYIFLFFCRGESAHLSREGREGSRTMMVRAFAGKNSSTIDRKEVRFPWDKNCGFFLRRLIKFSLGNEPFFFFAEESTAAVVECSFVARRFA